MDYFGDWHLVRIGEKVYPSANNAQKGGTDPKEFSSY